jgi:hypothetical protein
MKMQSDRQNARAKKKKATRAGVEGGMGQISVVPSGLEVFVNMFPRR